MKSGNSNPTLTAVDCNALRESMADLLLVAEYAQQHPELELHLAACVPCRTEMTELRATFAALDRWEAPEPTPYFDSRLQARLREAQQEAPEGLWERISAFFRYSSNATLRPVMAGALGVLLLAGGGAFAGFHPSVFGVNGRPSAAVDDLQRLDTNAQTLQQMGQLLDDGNGATTADQGGAPQPTT